MDWETPRDDRSGVRSQDPRVVAGTRGCRLGRQRTGPGPTAKTLAIGGQQTAAPKADDNPAADTPQSIRLDQIHVPGVTVKAIPVNPTDPIAIVNNQVITRQQLSDECVARRGKEILDTLINRVLIEQALKSTSRKSRPPRSTRKSRTWPAGSASAVKPGCEPWTRSADQPRAVRARHHLPRAGPAQALHRPGRCRPQRSARSLRLSVRR